MASYGDFEYERTYSGIEITSYQGSASSVNIPAQINGVPVTTIGNKAFWECSALTSVVISNSVKTIGKWAFSRCSSLTSIVIPDSVTSIGNEAFRKCESLTSIVIPDSVTSIGDSAFEYCFSLTSIVVPDSVTTIGKCAFSGCKSLTSIVIPDSVTSICDCAFIGCKSLTSIVIPDSVTSIGNSAYGGCESLTSVVISNSVKTIGDRAFSRCSSLTSIVIPDSVTTIGNGAFRYCTSLTSVVIPDSVTSIGNEAFRGCSSLKNALICNPDTGTSSAFDTHTDITYARFPKSLMKSAVFKNTLQNCRDDYSKIRYYQFLNNFFDKIRRLQNASNLPDDIRTSVKQLETLFYSNKYTSTMNSDISKILDDFITIQELQKKVQKIETNSVINLITLVNGVSQKKITNAPEYIKPFNIKPFNDEIDKIKVAAQENLRALTGEKTTAKRQTAPVTNRPANERQSTPVSNISDTDDKNRKIYETFQALNKGRTVTSRPRDFSIEDNSVGITIKKYNGSADFVNIPSQINGLPVTKIGDGAFGDCKSLTSIVIPDSVTTIGNGAFRDCKSLTSIVIPNSVTIISGSAFRKCESLKTIYFPRALMDVNGRDNTLKDFRNEYNDKIRYYNTVSEIKELMESPDFEK